MASTHSKSPYARMRRRLFALCGQQFENASNLWLVYSSRTDRRWLVRGDLQYLHFLSIEFSRDVRTFDLAPTPHVMERSRVGEVAKFDAVVVLLEGRKEYCQIEMLRSGALARERDMLLQSAAVELGGTYRRITIEELEPCRVRIQNSLRMLRFIAAARHLTLTEARNAVIACLTSQAGGTSLLELSRQIPQVPPALVLTAVFKLVQQRRLDLELDRQYVTMMSVVKVLQ